MAGAIKHKFASAVADGGDATLVRPQANWNDRLAMSEGSDGDKAIRDSVQTDGWQLVEYDAARLTNQTGAGSVDGDVIALSSANDTATVLEDVQGSLRTFVVAKATIANATAGLHAKSGRVTGVKATGVITRGDYVRKSATTKTVESTGVAQASGTLVPQGTLGLALTTAAAGLVTVLWFGTTVQPGVPTGAISMYGAAVAPTGYLLCDGTAVSRTTYAALFAIISTTYGGGDGSTTFNVPNMQSRSPLGFGQGSGLTNRTLATIGGEENHSLTIAELAAHAHPGSGVNIRATASEAAGHGTKNPGDGFTDRVQVDGAPATTVNVASQGSGAAHNTMHPFLTVNFIIKT